MPEHQTPASRPGFLLDREDEPSGLVNLRIDNNVRYGSLADKPSSLKIDFCPLWSESGHSAAGLIGLWLNSEPGTQRFQGRRFKITTFLSAWRSAALVCHLANRPSFGEAARRLSTARGGMLNLAKRHPPDAEDTSDLEFIKDFDFGFYKILDHLLCATRGPPMATMGGG